MFRFLSFGVRMAQQAVPVGGVYLAGWATASGLALYWVESLLLVAATLLLLWRAPRQQGGPELPKLQDVAAFQGGSFLMFGLFFAAFLLIAHHNLGMPFEARQVWEGLPLILGCVVVGLVIDLLELKHAGRGLVLARVNAGNGRWAVFWLVGFFGTLGAMFTGKLALFFGLFAGAKILFELGQVLGTGNDAPPVVKTPQRV